MTKISLKVVIAGREYPLSINEREKDLVLNSAKEINDKIKILQENYAVKDKQDLIAMSALQIAIKLSQNSNNKNVTANKQNEIINKLNNIISKIDNQK